MSELPFALLIDGENISSDLAPAIFSAARKHGPLPIRRVYGDAARLNGWSGVPGLRVVHSGSGKNATDLLLCIEAMELFHSRHVAGVVLAASDRDYTHLALHLRERGFPVVGLGEAKTPHCFRLSCSRFETLAAMPAKLEPKAPAAVILPQLDQAIHEMIRAEGGSMVIALLGSRMHSQHKVLISTFPEKTWRAYLTARPGLYQCDPKGSAAKVRLVPAQRLVP